MLSWSQNAWMLPQSVSLLSGLVALSKEFVRDAKKEEKITYYVFFFFISYSKWLKTLWKILEHIWNIRASQEVEQYKACSIQLKHDNGCRNMQTPWTKGYNKSPIQHQHRGHATSTDTKHAAPLGFDPSHVSCRARPGGKTPIRLGWVGQPALCRFGIREKTKTRTRTRTNTSQQLPPMAKPRLHHSKLNRTTSTSPRSPILTF